MHRVLIALLMLQLGCARPTHENPGPNLNLQEKLTTFETVQTSVLNQHCVTCHQPGKNRIILTSRDAVLRGPGLVTPGIPEKSLIYTALRDQQMPPSGPLDDDSIKLVYDWILGLEARQISF